MKSAPTIFVMERGFVLVGRVVEETSFEITLNDVAVIRRWGTTRGLGQLAMDGPLSSTQLDIEPDGTIINKLCCYRRLPCNATKWSEHPK